MAGNRASARLVTDAVEETTAPEPAGAGAGATSSAAAGSSAAGVSSAGVVSAGVSSAGGGGGGGVSGAGVTVGASLTESAVRVAPAMDTSAAEGKRHFF
jgi:hypothetical protein